METSQPIAPPHGQRIDVQLHALRRDRTDGHREHHAPLWSVGLRPFFLACAAYGALQLPLWLAKYWGYWDWPLTWTPRLWHVHEMIFGLVMAAIAGFVLTAVPRWTQSAPPSPTTLKILVGLWILGRVGMNGQAWLPAAAVAIVDLAFPVGVFVLIARPIFASRAWHNVPVVVALLMLTIANGLLHGLAGFDNTSARFGYIERAALLIGLQAVALLIALITGRVIPLFTRAALVLTGRSHHVQSRGWLDRAAVLSIGVYTLVALAGLYFSSLEAISAATALITAIFLVARMRYWETAKIWRAPLVGILHLGHLWLVLAFVLLALHHVDPIGVPYAAAVHALTVGCMASLILGMMTRAGLGHTGHPLRAHPLIVGSYALINVAALLRLIAAWPTTPGIAILIASAGLCFSLAFAAYFWHFLPILTRASPASAPSLPNVLAR